MRYRSGGAWSAGGLTIRAPCGSVGHGGHYHSQSPEAYFTHVPGIKVVVASGPAAAKGLLLAAARDRDPVVFFEPKLLYRTAVEEVPVGDVEVALGEAAVVRVGSDVTLVGWGQQVAVLLGAVRVCVCVVWRDGWGGGRGACACPPLTLTLLPPLSLSLFLTHTNTRPTSWRRRMASPRRSSTCAPSSPGTGRPWRRPSRGRAAWSSRTRRP